MQLFKVFFLNTKKKLVHISLYFMVFIILMILDTNSETNDRTSGFDVNATQLNILIDDQDQSTLSEGFLNYIKDNHVVFTDKRDKSQIVDDLYYQDLDYSLTIPEGFEKKILQGDFEHIVQNTVLPESNNAQLMDSQIQQYLSILTAYLAADSTPEQAIASTQKSMHQKGVMEMSINNTNSNTKMYSFYIFFPYILICMITVGLGSILITFRKKEINTRITCSCLPVRRKNAILLVCCLLFGVTIFILFLLAGIILLNGENFFDSTGLLFLGNSAVFLLVSLSLTYLVSHLTNTSSMLDIAANILGLGLCFLGGLFVPLDIMSATVVKAAHFLPSFWYTSALEIIPDIANNPNLMEKYLTYLGIQGMFSITILAIALVCSKYKKVN